MPRRSRALSRRRPARSRPEVRPGGVSRVATRTVGALAIATAVIGAGTAAATRSTGPAATRVVSYAGLSIAVPASWPVVDLDVDPHACVRLDRHAVFVGTPGTRQDCPAHLVGRTETVQLGPAASSAAGVPTLASPVTAAAGAVPAAAVSTADRQIALAATGSGAQLTVTWGSDESLARQIAASAVRQFVVASPRTAPSPVTAGQPVPLYPVGASSTMLTGFAFDTCAAPSVAAMRAWKRSTYSGVAVYIGGSNRACGDGNLSASWVDSVVNGQHWRLLPIYVGLQAPCSGSRFARVSYSPATAYSQGLADAADAVGDARRFGLAAGTGVYADMEGYGVAAGCTTGVLQYLSGWTSGLHGAGYLAGVYSSDASGIYDLGRHADDPGLTVPDLVWSARWDGVATTADRNLSASQWVTHQRVKQYLGDHHETWGGATIDVDSDYVDSATSTVGYRVTVTQATQARRRPTGGAAVAAAVAANATVTATCWVPQGGGSTATWVELSDGSFLSRSVLDLHGQAPPRCGLLYTTWIAVNARTGPGAQYPVAQRVPAAGGAWVVCQAPGLKVRTSIVWDRLRNGNWIADYWMNTPGSSTWSPAIPRC